MVALDTAGYVVGPAGTVAGGGGGGSRRARDGQELCQGRKGDIGGDHRQCDQQSDDGEL